MCGRSSLTKTEKEIEKRFNATFYSEELERYNPLPNFNVAPTHLHPIISLENRSHLQLYRWGLIPFWAKDKKIGSTLINARVETINEKPAFKQLLARRRCIVPFDGFYEWKTDGKTKTPFRIQTVDQEIFAIAGLYDVWKDPGTSEVVQSFTLITMAANEFMKSIHDRMPAILSKEEELLWLDMSLSTSDLLQILKPYPDDLMKAYEVSDQVNNVRNNTSILIEPFTKPRMPVQTTLF